MVDGVDDAGVLRVRLRAAPADGAANAALVRLLASALGVPRTSISIRRGAMSRVKIVEFDGLDQAVLSDRWPGLKQG